jgi:hypothetical protein
MEDYKKFRYYNIVLLFDRLDDIDEICKLAKKYGYKYNLPSKSVAIKNILSNSKEQVPVCFSDYGKEFFAGYKKWDKNNTKHPNDKIHLIVRYKDVKDLNDEQFELWKKLNGG